MQSTRETDEYHSVEITDTSTGQILTVTSHWLEDQNGEADGATIVLQQNGQRIEMRLTEDSLLGITLMR